ncbi:CDG_1a_G0046980.mRNA.1.CDS.1 [Saccharomyces cerevisiae]|nr:CDG_1a_G0046980.mRNA.1.CDS.1 [Saccharomyces cerevisiae]CAI7449040.1 CDG_1a_G0046980.mRNA.1.CDS.1 [Saccharomyces cerevisiae]
MSVSTPSELDALIEQATSESIPNGDLDLPIALEISDVLRSRRVNPKDSMRCIKKRILNTADNPNTQLSSWKLTNICVKNGGTPFIKEICSREFMDTMEHVILREDSNEELSELVKTILYELYVAFKNDSQLNYVAKVYDKLISRGIKFPEKLTLSNSPTAMFDSKTPADWIDSDACMICSKKFSLLNRKHHCRSCGGVFCQEHSSNSIPLPDLGIYEPVRVCDSCFEDYDLKRHDDSKKSKKHRHKRKKDRDYSTPEDEEELIRKAIELSLKESRNSASSEPIVPVVESKNEVKRQEIEEEEDPDLKAAIQESLREAEEAKLRSERQKASRQMQPQQPSPQPQPIHSVDLSDEEKDSIYMFASLVEKMKSRPLNEILEDSKLQNLAQRVFASKARLNYALNDKAQKYNTLIEMNGKISEIMNIYDRLLEQQLQSINLSQQYTLPQIPSDPYNYLTENVQKPAESYQTPPLQQLSSHQYKPQQDVSRQQSVKANSSPTTNIDHLKTIDVTPHAQQKPQSHVELAPSEPPYPKEEAEDEGTQAVQDEESSTQESRERPYPVETENGETSINKRPQGITRYDFPTVPARKFVQPESTVPLPASSSEIPIKEERPPSPQEELLIEL